MKKCKRCGLNYEPTGRNQKYCSSCGINAKRDYIKQYHKETKEYYKSLRKRPKRTITCKDCGIEMIARSSGHKYCDKCYKKIEDAQLSRLNAERDRINKKAFKKGRWSQTEKDYVYRRRKEGATIFELAERLGRTVDSVRYMDDKFKGINAIKKLGKGTH